MKTNGMRDLYTIDKKNYSINNEIASWYQDPSHQKYISRWQAMCRMVAKASIPLGAAKV